MRFVGADYGDCQRGVGPCEKRRMEDTTAGSDRQGIQVIARAAAILRAVEGHSDGLSLGEIAQRVGLARSTVQRIVGALVEEQLLAPVAARGGVRLGPLLVRLGGAANVEILPIALPIMRELSARVRETVDLSVLNGAAALFIEQVRGPHRLAAVSGVGEEFPLHATANGKAMLASLPAGRRAALLSTLALEPFTAHTLTDPADVEHDLATVELTGLAWDREEHSEGVSAVGAGFVDAFGRHYALSIPAPSARFESQAERLTGPLLEARDRLARAVA